MAGGSHFYVDQKALKMISWPGMLQQAPRNNKHRITAGHEEFQPRTMWSLSNAFTSAFKELEPIPQYKATAKLAGFLQAVRLS
jgi:hypothetical protein